MVLLANQFIDILAYVTIGIIALYFLLFLIPLIFALTKKKEVLKKQKNINLIFIQQSHVLSDVVKLIHEEDVTLDVSLMEKISKINQSLVGRKDMIKKEEIAPTVEWNISDLTIRLNIRLLPGKTIFESTYAAIEASTRLPKVPAIEISTVLKMYLEKGTHDVLIRKNRSL